MSRIVKVYIFILIYIALCFNTYIPSVINIVHELYTEISGITEGQNKYYQNLPYKKYATRSSCKLVILAVQNSPGKHAEAPISSQQSSAKVPMIIIAHTPANIDPKNQDSGVIINKEHFYIRSDLQKILIAPLTPPPKG